MKAKATSILFCCMVTLLLTACGSSPPVRYFSLSPTVSTVGQQTDDAAALGLGPIRMPEYLNRSQLVTRGAGQEMQVDEFNRWAEPLSDALHRIVSTDVDNAIDTLVVTAFPWESAVHAGVDYRLIGHVSRFDADRAGGVMLDVQWGISEIASGDMVVQPHRSRYEAQAESPEDPASIAAAMNDALAGFSRDIADRMRAVLKN